MKSKSKVNLQKRERRCHYLGQARAVTKARLHCCSTDCLSFNLVRISYGLIALARRTVTITEHIARINRMYCVLETKIARNTLAYISESLTKDGRRWNAFASNLRRSSSKLSKCRNLLFEEDHDHETISWAGFVLFFALIFRIIRVIFQLTHYCCSIHSSFNFILISNREIKFQAIEATDVRSWSRIHRSSLFHVELNDMSKSNFTLRSICCSWQFLIQAVLIIHVESCQTMSKNVVIAWKKRHCQMLAVGEFGFSVKLVNAFWEGIVPTTVSSVRTIMMLDRRFDSIHRENEQASARYEHFVRPTIEYTIWSHDTRYLQIQSHAW